MDIPKSHPSDEEPRRRGHSGKFRVLKNQFTDAAGASLGRTLPHSLEAEEYLLSTILLDGRDIMARCLAYRMREDWFYDSKHGDVFAAALKLYGENKPIDIATVAEELKTSRKLDQIGGYAFLTQVSSRIPTTAQATYFIEKVRDGAAMRALIRENTKQVEDIYANSGGCDELKTQLELHQQFTSRTLDMLRAGTASAKEEAALARQRTENKRDGKLDKSRWLFTGLKEFDERFGALDANNEDWLVIVGAFQGGGKSSFKRKVILTNLRAGKTVQAFLLETGLTGFLEQMACTDCEISAKSIPDLPRDLKEKFTKSYDEIFGYVNKTLFVYQDNVPAETIIARIDDFARQHGAAADLIAIDHIHCLNVVSKNGIKREQEMGMIAKMLARCGKRHNRTILALAQLNRSARSEGGNTRPQPHNIRDSGEIEQAARRIIFLHVPNQDIRGTDQTENQDVVTVEIYTAKHNNGAVGWREFWFKRSQTRFIDIHDREMTSAKATNAATSHETPGASKATFKKGKG